MLRCKIHLNCTHTHCLNCQLLKIINDDKIPFKTQLKSFYGRKFSRKINMKLPTTMNQLVIFIHDIILKDSFTF